jgi:hypothetical protein
MKSALNYPRPFSPSVISRGTVLNDAVNSDGDMVSSDGATAGTLWSNNKPVIIGAGVLAIVLVGFFVMRGRSA